MTVASTWIVAAITPPHQDFVKLEPMITPIEIDRLEKDWTVPVSICPVRDLEARYPLEVYHVPCDESGAILQDNGGDSHIIGVNAGSPRYPGSPP